MNKGRSREIVGGSRILKVGVNGVMVGVGK